MHEFALLAAFVAAAFFVAGAIKGAVGVGLPTVVMGLLGIVMPPAQAAALMVLPAIGTNLWQMAAGPSLGALLRRHAAMIVMIFAGTFLTIDFMTRMASHAAAALGAVLAGYGVYGLFARRFEVSRATERWLGPLTGLAIGLLMGATGIFVIPTVPYLTSLRMDKEELLQSIGIAAFVCPLALGLALATQGNYPSTMAAGSLLAVFPALAGMYAGQRLRQRLDARSFMRWFFLALIGLGGYMVLRSL